LTKWESTRFSKGHGVTARLFYRCFFMCLGDIVFSFIIDFYIARHIVHYYY
jgi:hypothetical protein